MEEANLAKVLKVKRQRKEKIFANYCGDSVVMEPVNAKKNLGFQPDASVIRGIVQT